MFISSPKYLNSDINLETKIKIRKKEKFIQKIK